MTYFILDLDYTLLDTQAFKKALAISLQLAPEQLMQNWHQFDVGHYDPWRHATFLKQPPEVHKMVEKVINASGAYLFPGVLSWCQTQLSTGHQLILITRGDHNFQRAKAVACGLEPLCMKILTVEGSKTDALSKLDIPSHQWCIVNDDLTELQEMTQSYPAAQAILISGPYSSGGTTKLPEHDGREFFTR